MSRIITIDEAMDILQKLKNSGEDFVLISNLDIKSGTSIAAIPISINKSFLVVKNSRHPISYAENCIMRSLKTQTDIENISTLMFK